MVHVSPSFRDISLTAVDLFSGCGGLSLGLRDAGFDVLAAVELDEKARETYKLNHPGVRLFEADIRMVDPLKVMEEAGLRRGELDLLAGCPPCQGFSRLRTRNKASFVQDARNDLVWDFMRFVEATNPKTIMLENVPALGKNERFFDIKRRLIDIGFQVSAQVLDAADYGVPQRRKRLIMLASRVGQPVAAPPAQGRMTVREALAGLAPPSHTGDSLHALKEKRSQAVRDIIRLIPKDGGSRSDLGAEYQVKCHIRSNGYKDVYGRMRWDDVAPTITSGCHNPSKGRFIHPEQDRTITLREAALLQGFPRDYKFRTAHGKESIALMIGNALPPPFIAAQAESLRNCLLSERTRIVPGVSNIPKS